MTMIAPAIPRKTTLQNNSVKEEQFWRKHYSVGIRESFPTSGLLKTLSTWSTKQTPELHVSKKSIPWTSAKWKFFEHDISLIYARDWLAVHGRLSIHTVVWLINFFVRLMLFSFRGPYRFLYMTCIWSISFFTLTM